MTTNRIERPLKCGCTVDGDGTLLSPLTVKQCSAHAAAPELLEALTGIADLVSMLLTSGLHEPVAVIDAVSFQVSEARAAIRKAEGQQS